MFDIIGFKALRVKKGSAGLYQQFTRGIAPAIQHSAAGNGKFIQKNGIGMYVPDFSEFSVGFRAISDTVIFFTKDDSFKSFASIVNSSFMLLQHGFGGGKAPFRGAIGWGDFINDPQGILIGSAIEDAYVGESSQAWAGAMLTNSCRDFSVEKGYIESYKSLHMELSQQVTDEREKRTVVENSNRLVEYHVPIQINPKDSPVIYEQVKTYVIDWTIRMYEGASKKSFDPSKDKHAQTIAKNTLVFENWARSNNRDL